MKKIAAVCLAAALMLGTAFAQNPEPVRPDTSGQKPTLHKSSSHNKNTSRKKRTALTYEQHLSALEPHPNPNQGPIVLHNSTSATGHKSTSSKTQGKTKSTNKSTN
jgi:hypothetical protein